MPDSPPLLSIVVTSRNDDHGGNLVDRMQLFVNGLLQQASRHNLSAELIIVEWNPPPDRLRLVDVLKWPSKPGSCAVRIIEVPAEIHKRFDHSEKLPLFQMIAKNVGIRRAQGHFVLATNIDILFSDEMMKFLASDQLTDGCLYRVDRYDVPSDIPDDVSIDEQLKYCWQNVLRINRRNDTRVLGNGDFNLRRLVKGARSSLREIRRIIRGEEQPLHTNACGDFTLMAREHWFTVRGYPEFNMYSFRLDGLLCYAAHFAGARETVLKVPMRIYHIEHSPGSGWTPGVGGELLAKRLTKADVPQLSGEQYAAWVTEMCCKRQPIIFNQSEAWGLADENLSETTIAGGISN